jgi:cytochrome c
MTAFALACLLSLVSQSEPADAGQTVFERRCSGCHHLDRDGEGPRLGDVYGRAAGTVSGFGYSDALKNAHITWDADSLEKWLTDPESVVPGNTMDFRVASAEERAQLIAFLKRNAKR